jgi:hypothetical protein
MSNKYREPNREEFKELKRKYPGDNWKQERKAFKKIVQRMRRENPQ